jgi:hypothetical protein
MSLSRTAKRENEHTPLQHNTPHSLEPKGSAKAMALPVFRRQYTVLFDEYSQYRYSSNLVWRGQISRLKVANPGHSFS